MTQISMKELYDDRSVIAQITDLKDSNAKTVQTVEQKVADVQQLSTDVASAVSQANNASATAQSASQKAEASATIVQDYDNRLTSLEGNAVRLNPEGGASAHQKIVGGIESDEMQTDNLNVLETVDADTVQSHALNVIDSAVVPNTANGSVSQYAVNAKRLMEEPSIVRTTGNQDIAGIKGFTTPQTGKVIDANLTDRPSENRSVLTRLVSTKNQNAGWMYVRNQNRITAEWKDVVFETANATTGLQKVFGLRFDKNLTTGKISLVVVTSKGPNVTLAEWTDEDLIE